MNLRLFCQSNNDSAGRPGERFRTIQLTASPDEPALKRVDGAPAAFVNCHFQNVSLEIAAAFTAGQEYEVTFTPIATKLKK